MAMSPPPQHDDDWEAKTADLVVNAFTAAKMRSFISVYASGNQTFTITLANHEVCGYHAVFHNSHQNGSEAKVRVLLVAADGAACAWWEMSILLEEVIGNGAFSDDVERLVIRALGGLKGSTMLTVTRYPNRDKYVVAKAAWHEDNLWP